MFQDPNPLPPLPAQRRAIIAEAQTIYSAGVKSVLESLGIETCGVFTDGPSAMDSLSAINPSLVVINHMITRTAPLQKMLLRKPDLRILCIHLGASVEVALRILREGARGCMNMDGTVQELADAVRVVVGGGLYVHPQLQKDALFEAVYDPDSDTLAAIERLTPTELRVFEAYGYGFSTARVAEHLGVSIKTVETHRANIKDKLAVSTYFNISKLAVQLRAAEILPYVSRTK